MKLEAMGIDTGTFYHRKNPLTPEENAFLALMWVDHVGEENKISAQALAARYRERVAKFTPIEWCKREIRHMQNHLLFDHNIPVLSQAGNGGGYWIAENDDEGKAFYSTFRKRGLTGLVKASRGRQSAMVDMITQLSFKFEELVDKTMSLPKKDRASVPAPVEVVDAFLQKMLEDPERFSDGLKLIGEKYGSVLIPRGRFDAMIGAIKMRARELQELASSLEE